MNLKENIENYYINRDDQSEFLQKFMHLTTNIEGFENKSVLEIFSPANEVLRREFIVNNDAEKYCKLISGVNGILRRKDKKDWSMDGVGVTAIGQEVIGGHIFPRYEDKKEIIIKSWEAAQRMNDSGRELEEIGMLLGSLLVETHPFMDGNGRTSRFVYQMIKDGYDKEKITTILGEDGRDELDMALLKNDYDELFYDKFYTLSANNNIASVVADKEFGPFGQLFFKDSVSEDVKNDLICAGRNDNMLLTLAVVKYFSDHLEERHDGCLKNFPAMEYLGKHFPEKTVILFQDFISKQTDVQLQELVDIYWSIKKQYTEGLIDVFESPDKSEYLIGVGDKKKRMIDVFKERIASKQMLY